MEEAYTVVAVVASSPHIPVLTERRCHVWSALNDTFEEETRMGGSDDFVDGRREGLIEQVRAFLSDVRSAVAEGHGDDVDLGRLDAFLHAVEDEGTAERCANEVEDTRERLEGVEGAAAVRRELERAEESFREKATELGDDASLDLP